MNIQRQRIPERCFSGPEHNVKLDLPNCSYLASPYNQL